MTIPMLLHDTNNYDALSITFLPHYEIVIDYKTIDTAINTLQSDTIQLTLIIR